MDRTELIDDWMTFLQNSPSPFHAVEEVLHRISRSTAKQISPWLENQELVFDAVYYVKGEGTIIAFYLPPLSSLKEMQKHPTLQPDSGTILPFRIWGSHTDSPTLRLKPQPVSHKNNYSLIATEVYGSPILNTWLDKPLGIAGKFFTRASKNDKNNKITEHLVKTGAVGPHVVITNAAIHLNREINTGFKLISDVHLKAFYAAQPVSQAKQFKGHDVLADLVSQLGENLGYEDILAHELCFYDLNPPFLIGKEQEFINARNLDNLAMVHAGLTGWLQSLTKLAKINGLGSAQHSATAIPMIAFFNHEEIGSNTFEGAGSQQLKDINTALYEKLKQHFLDLNITSSREKSFILSADMTNGFHPSYENWYEEKNRAYLNHGPTIKYNANYRYAGSGAQIAQVRHMIDEVGIPVQEYLSHSEVPCGSTIGPVMSSRLGIPTVDIGNPLLAMHSSRETAGVEDHIHMVALAEKFFFDF